MIHSFIHPIALTHGLMIVICRSVFENIAKCISFVAVSPADICLSSTVKYCIIIPVLDILLLVYYNTILISPCDVKYDEVLHTNYRKN